MVVAAWFLASLAGGAACRPGDGEPDVQQVVPGWGRLESPVEGGMAWYRVEGQGPNDSALRDFGIFGVGAFRGPGPDATLLLVQERPGRGLWDSLVVSRSGLAPRWERMATGSTVVHLEYDGPTVRRSEWRGDTLVDTDSVVFATPVFAFNQLDVLLRSLPPEVSDRMILPLYSEGTGVVEYDTVTVSRLRDRGERRRWEVRFADPAIVLTATASQSDLVDYEVVQRASGMRIWRRRVPAPK